MSHGSDISSNTSVSSSGISDSNITILGDNDDNRLTKELQRLLETKYTIALPCCAGRRAIDNLISRVRHAKTKIIILSQKTFKDFSSFLETVIQPGLLSLSSTLILYEKGLDTSLINRCFRNIICLQRQHSPDEITRQIDIFIDAQQIRDQQRDEDQRSIKQIFVDQLLQSVISQLGDVQLTLLQLHNRFEEQHGLWSSFCVKEFSKYIEESKVFSLTVRTVRCQWNNPTERQNHQVSLDQSLKCNETTNSFSLSNPTSSILESRDEEETSVKEVFTPCNEEITRNPLLSYFDNTNSQYSFFLLSGKLTPTDDLHCIANIPWLKVFDFDADSRENGLLSVVESRIKKQMCFTLSTSTDAAADILSDKATNWYFPLGMKGKPETLLNDSVLDWYHANQKVLEHQFQILSNFCLCTTCPVFIIMWYGCNEKETRCLEWFLDTLYRKLPPNLFRQHIILFTSDVPNSSSKIFQQIVEKFELESSVWKSPISKVLQWFPQQKKIFNFLTNGQMQLPCMSNEDQLRYGKITEEELAWLNTLLEILPLKDPDLNTVRSEDAGKEFAQGGIISWDDLSAGDTAVDREAEACLNINDLIENDLLADKKSLILNIQHEPGSGGTTFSRKLLWSIHRDVPCCVLSATESYLNDELLERIEFLQKKTSSPVVLLMDGRSEHEVNQIFDSCNLPVMIINVQRLSDDLDNYYDPRISTCYFTGKVTLNEGVKFKNVFSRLSPKSNRLLADLTKNIPYEDRFVFEYGLTAFEENYRGLRSYVDGYLQTQKLGSNLFDGAPWQKAVVYLSLVSYYANGYLPREIFCKTFNCNSFSIRLGDLESGKHFVLEIGNRWKIRYYQIAKEILEQSLSFTGNTDDYRSRDLSEGACRNLHTLVIEFITMVKSAMSSYSSNKIEGLLLNMMFRRDRKRSDKKPTSEKQGSLSRLLQHVKEDENRIKIAKHLADAFPNHAEFHAHLGRLFNLMQRFEEGEESLQKALDIRKEERRGIRRAYADDNLGRIYNMFGYAFINRANHAVTETKKNKNLDILKIISLVNRSINHFREARRFITYNRSFSYVGEVKARLLIARLVHRKLSGGCIELLKNKQEKIQVGIQTFIWETQVLCPQLVEECRLLTLPKERKIVSEESEKCISKYLTYFSAFPQNFFQSQTVSASIPMKRAEIICIMMKHQTDSKKAQIAIEKVVGDQDVNRIIKLLEDILQGVIRNRTSTESIKVDVIQWLEAIRHPNATKDYSLVQVLDIVNGWYSKEETALGLFYLYVVYFLLSVHNCSEDSGREYNAKAKELQDKLKSRRHRLYKVPNQEVLARHNSSSIRKLLCVSKFASGRGIKFWEKHEARNRFQVCTGTIVYSAKPESGIIQLDLDHQKPKYTVKVSFVPMHYGLTGKRLTSEATKVEFFMRFSLERGAEAVAVKQLSKSRCVRCSENSYIITLNQTEPNKCFTCIN